MNNLLKIELEQIRNSYIKESNIYPETLYHYSDAPGLHGIISSKTIWATHRHFLNDRTEVNYTQDLVEKLKDDLLKKVPDLFESKNKDYDSNYAGLLLRLSYKSLRPKPDPDIYVISFCEDNDLLSQWRGYGESGSGYSIGFQTSLLKEIDTDFQLKKVIYSEKEQLEILRGVLTEVLKSFEKTTTGMSSEEMHKEADTHASIFEEEVAIISTYFKHPSFHEENEWRLVCNSDYASLQNNQIKFRSSANGIIPYIELGDTENDKRGVLPIRDIRIGPTTEFNTAVKAIRMLSQPIYPDIKIYSSSIPLR